MFIQGPARVFADLGGMRVFGLSKAGSSDSDELTCAEAKPYCTRRAPLGEAGHSSPEGQAAGS